MNILITYDEQQVEIDVIFIQTFNKTEGGRSSKTLKVSAAWHNVPEELHEHFKRGTAKVQHDGDSLDVKEYAVISDVDGYPVGITLLCTDKLEEE